jgi:cob(I)alamin adenosyltransferase
MIYTKTGDDGTTSLIGGTRVKKYDIRVKAYGEIDELVSFIGYISAFLHHDEYKGELFVIQNKLFTCESLVACEKEDIKKKMPEIKDVDIAYLERKIDTMNEDLPEIHEFIIPSESQTACLMNMARTMTRKCERLCVEVSDNYKINNNIIKYLNRLSDYFFVLSRRIMKQKHRPEKFWKEN